ncbi:MAG: sugar ABC transporter ATP-binding protein [Oliverpabstia sp.]
MIENSKNILEIRNIYKSFPGVKALSDISFDIKKGEVRALSGENGAGKSTLIKILTGVNKSDSGEIILDGEKVSFSSTQESHNKGIRAVYQELNLIPYLSVAENLFLGEFPLKKTGIDWPAVYRETEKCLKELELDIDSHAIINDLGAAAQQMISIAIAIRSDCKLLILDEATSSLDKKEVELLFSIIRKLKKKGVSFIFITHRMEEIYQICDSITVLKDGKYIGTYPVDKLNQSQLVTLMVGKEVNVDERMVSEISDCIEREPIIELRNVRSMPRVLDVNLKLYNGEILGIAGLLGSGRSETMQILAGCRKMENGEMCLYGKKVRLKNPTDSVKHRIIYCSENRRVDGIIPDMSVENNLTLCSLKKLSRFGIINKKKSKRVVDDYVERFEIKTPRKDQMIKLLSGGNQQKVLLARGLATNPKVILLDEPTRGIDVGAKQEILTLIRKMANKGIGVIVISSDLSELVRISNRIVVFREGVSVKELKGKQISQDNIMRVIAGEKIETEVSEDEK